MGAHGFMEEYYLTFNKENGYILVYEEIIGAKAFPDSIKLLEQKLTAKEAQYRDKDMSYTQQAWMLNSLKRMLLK